MLGCVECFCSFPVGMERQSRVASNAVQVHGRKGPPSRDTRALAKLLTRGSGPREKQDLPVSHSLTKLEFNQPNLNISASLTGTEQFQTVGIDC